MNPASPKSHDHLKLLTITDTVYCQGLSNMCRDAFENTTQLEPNTETRSCFKKILHVRLGCVDLL